MVILEHDQSIIEKILQAANSNDKDKLFSQRDLIVWLCGFVVGKELKIDDLRDQIDDLKDHLRHARGVD